MTNLDTHFAQLNPMFLGCQLVSRHVKVSSLPLMTRLQGTAMHML